MAETDYTSQATAEVDRLTEENFGNPNLPEIIWLSGYMDGFRSGTDILTPYLFRGSR